MHLNTDQTVTISRVDARRRGEALSLLLTGRAYANDNVSVEFMDFAAQQGFALDHLWAAYRGRRPIAASLIIPGAGRAAMFFVSPVMERSDAPVTTELVKKSCQGQDTASVRIIQALLDPEQRLEADALHAAGFTTIAQLQYMQCRTQGASPTPHGLGPSTQVVNWTPQRQGLFAQAILSSYQDTLDCPRLVGMRDIDDIIASHMASGQFVPELWSVVLSHDEPVAVVLFNRLPEQRALELVYLGVSPAWRRRGVAKKLVGLGLSQAQRHGAGSMILAVDEANTPAKRLYSEMGFVNKARKHAMIFASL